MGVRVKILIIGGYGIFGGRLVELLAEEARLEIIVAGRSIGRAEAFCKERAGAGGVLVPAAFDRDGDVNRQIAALAPEIVVDASGPFQDYGDAPYKVVEACIASGAHYIDLADGSGFVDGIAAFDEAARKAGVFILSGVSSFPVLTALVVRELGRGMDRVTHIRGGIAPSPFAGVGENVIRAIAGYAGQKISVRKNGADGAGYPFTETVRYTIAPPGHVPLRPVLFSLVDVPDLRLLPQLWPQVKTVWMGAGPVPEVLHRVLIGFAWLVRMRVLRSLSPLVPLIGFVMNHIRWGEHRGGMFVEVTGTDTNGAAAVRSWHLLAEGRDGPLIPSMAAAAVIRRRLDGKVPAPGARTAIEDIGLADYEALFAARTIYTGRRQDAPAPEGPLYQRVLGAAWNGLPPQIKAMHDVAGAAAARGMAQVARGRNPMARLVANIIGFPKAGTEIPVEVDFTVRDGAEIWTRRFAGRPFFSIQSQGKGREERLLVERFGPMDFAMALVPEADGRLRLVLRSWRFLGVPMPMALCPRSESYETVQDGRFHFHVRISHPMVGVIVHYQGWLEKTDESEERL